MKLHPINRVFSNLTDHLPSTQVTILYEDLEAGLRAKALMSRALAGMDASGRIKLELWRFDWLRERSLRNIALGAAGRSMLVVISASTAKQLPAEMERWLSAWIQENEGPSALFGLLSAGRGRLNNHPLYDRLQRAAQQKHVEFFCEFFKPDDAPQPARRAMSPSNASMAQFPNTKFMNNKQPVELLNFGRS